jgi:hypothetical protein
MTLMQIQLVSCFTIKPNLQSLGSLMSTRGLYPVIIQGFLEFTTNLL